MAIEVVSISKIGQAVQSQSSLGSPGLVEAQTLIGLFADKTHNIVCRHSGSELELFVLTQCRLQKIRLRKMLLTGRTLAISLCLHRYMNSCVGRLYS